MVPFKIGKHNIEPFFTHLKASRLCLGNKKYDKKQHEPNTLAVFFCNALSYFSKHIGLVFIRIPNNKFI